MQSGLRGPLAAPRLDTLRRSNGRLRRRPPRARHRIYKWSYACRVCASRIDHWIDPGWNTVVGFVLAIPAKRLPVWAIRDFPTRPPRRRLGNAGSKPSPAHERRAAAEISLAFGDRPPPPPKFVTATRRKHASQICMQFLKMARLSWCKDRRHGRKDEERRLKRSLDFVDRSCKTVKASAFLRP